MRWEARERATAEWNVKAEAMGGQQKQQQAPKQRKRAPIMGMSEFIQGLT